MNLFEKLSSKGIKSNPVSFKNQVEAIAEFVKANQFSKTLETGLGIGGSASYILNSTRGIHVAMDPFQEAYFNNKGLENLENLGLLDRLEFYHDFSYHVLPKLILEGRTFDFIYIDGDHRFDVAMMDFYYCDMMLDIGGFLLLDDTWMPSLIALERFVENNRSKEYRKVDGIYENGSLYKKMNAIRGGAQSQYRVF